MTKRERLLTNAVAYTAITLREMIQPAFNHLPRTMFLNTLGTDLDTIVKLTPLADDWDWQVAFDAFRMRQNRAFIAQTALFEYLRIASWVW